MNRVLTAIVLFSISGCFKPPEIVMVDRATALEQQASGSFDDLERQLHRAGIRAAPGAADARATRSARHPSRAARRRKRTHGRRSAGRAPCPTLHRRGQRRLACRQAKRLQRGGRPGRGPNARRTGEPRSPTAVAMDARAAERPLRGSSCSMRGGRTTCGRGVRRLDQGSDGKWQGKLAEAAGAGDSDARAGGPLVAGAQRPTTWTTTISEGPSA